MKRRQIFSESESPKTLKEQNQKDNERQNNEVILVMRIATNADTQKLNG